MQDIGVRANPATAIADLFAGLSVVEAKGITLATIVMPMPGTGRAREDPRTIVKPLLDCALSFLERSQKGQKIIFVERDPSRAKVLDETMNAVLTRSRVTLASGEVVDSARQEVVRSIDEAIGIAGDNEKRTLLDLRRIAATGETRAFEIGLMGRRLTELVTRDVLGNNGKYELWKAIDELAKCHVADWVRSYLHTLRAFGNESAHERERDKRTPTELDARDLTVALFCMQRVVAFWVAYRRRKSGAGG